MAAGKDKQTHIGIFGRTNTGKSSLINVLTDQDIAIVSPEPGTTTDPVKKSIEIPGIGAVVFIDTAGIEDSSVLGEKRMRKTMSQIDKTDIAILVIDHGGIGKAEEKLIAEFEIIELPYLVVYNKEDIYPLPDKIRDYLNTRQISWTGFSCVNTSKRESLVELIKEKIPEDTLKPVSLVGDLISGGDTVLLVTPIDEEAPEGRLILPQVQVIRDILDNDGIAVLVKERELDVWMSQRSADPALVITDSQVFTKVAASVPGSIPLTSFSIILARQKGNFEAFLEGTPAISKLKENDRVLILESCSHHVSCDDIGRVKIPRWIDNFTGLSLNYTVISGLDDLPDEIEDYAMLIQCGGCMLTRRQVINRLRRAISAGIPVSNYGMAIAYTQGIFRRAVEAFVHSDNHHLEYL